MRNILINTRVNLNVVVEVLFFEKANNKMEEENKGF